jgi:Ca2+-binding EF-hand superfamily protein
MSDGGACLLNNILQYPFFRDADIEEAATTLGFRTEPHVVLTLEMIEYCLEEFDIMMISAEEEEGADLFADCEDQECFVVYDTYSWLCVRNINGYFWVLSSTTRAPRCLLDADAFFDYLDPLLDDGAQVFVLFGLFPEADELDLANAELTPTMALHNLTELVEDAMSEITRLYPLTSPRKLPPEIGMLLTKDTLRLVDSVGFYGEKDMALLEWKWNSVVNVQGIAGVAAKPGHRERLAEIRFKISGVGLYTFEVPDSKNTLVVEKQIERRRNFIRTGWDFQITPTFLAYTLEQPDGKKKHRIPEEVGIQLTDAGIQVITVDIASIRAGEPIPAKPTKMWKYKWSKVTEEEGHAATDPEDSDVFFYTVSKKGVFAFECTDSLKLVEEFKRCRRAANIMREIKEAKASGNKLAKVVLSRWQMKQIERLFTCFDEKNSGFITKDSLQTMCMILGLEKKFRTILQVADPLTTGKISFEDVCNVAIDFEAGFSDGIFLKMLHNAQTDLSMVYHEFKRFAPEGSLDPESLRSLLNLLGTNSSEINEKVSKTFELLDPRKT